MSDTDASLLQADELARREALDPARNLLLQAPAGSGKTTVLVCRILALLAVVDEPEEILAITFTRKAAAEMRGRVLAALRNAASGARPEALEAGVARAALERSRQRQWELLECPGRLRIQTIDAANQRLASLCPVLSGGGAALQLTANPQLLYERTARRALTSALADPQLGNQAELLFARLDNNWQKLEALLAEMLAQRSLWLPQVLRADDPVLEQRVSSSVRRIVAEVLSETCRLLPAALLAEATVIAAQAARELAQGRADTAEGAAAWLERDDLPADDPDDLSRWRFWCQLLLTAESQWRKTLNVRQGIAPGDKEFKQRALRWLADMSAVPGALEAWRQVDSLPDLVFRAEDSAALAALSQLLLHAASELQLEFTSHGAVDFTFVAAAARQALSSNGEPTDLALRTGAALRHILVDEFQDTSSEQLELLRAMTAGWSDGDGRTLFLVGDPMQSIYQFRAAEVGLFLQVREHGLGALQLEARELHRNFRSGAPLVNWVNEAGNALFPPADNARLGAIRFLPSLAARRERAAQVELHASTDHDAGREAQEILEVVRASWRDDPTASIAVLVASRHHAIAITEVLQAAGITVRGIKLTRLADRAVVRDLIALARALQHPGDRTAWLALLRSPCCGLELTELQLLAENQPALPWAIINDSTAIDALDDPAQQRVERLRRALAPALEGAERLESLHSRVHRCWLRSGGAALCRGERDLADARAFLNALADYPDPEQLAGDAFAALTDELYATPEAAAQCVEILTMHGAKGLEWDVVIVPALGRQRRSDTEPLLNALELPHAGGASDLLLAPIASRAGGARSLAGYIKRLRAQRRRLEQARLVYVAATRARLALHWFGHAEYNSTGVLQPVGGSLLAVLWPAVAGEFIQRIGTAPVAALAASLAGSAAPDAAQAPAVQRQRLPAGWRPEGVPIPLQRLPLRAQVVPPHVEYSWVGQGARAIGTIVHAELQRCAQQGGIDVGAPRWLERERYMEWLAQLGVEPAERAAAASQIQSALQQMQSDERGRWLLSSRIHREASSERRLTGLYQGRIVSIAIDRMLIDEHGVRWIVDFKTSTHLGGDLQGFLESEVERYLPQMQRYASLARRLGPEPVRCALYFPLLREFREVATASGADS